MSVLVINILILVTILTLVLIPAHKNTVIKDLSLAAAFSIFIYSLNGLRQVSTDGISMVAQYPRIRFPGLKIAYNYLLDDLSILFIILTTLLTIMVVITARNIRYRVKEKYILLFIVEILLINTFLTADLLLFYIFFEAILIPVFILIGLYGSKKDKVYAANQFFLYTLFGSFFMLTGLILLFSLTGTTNIFYLKGFLLDPTLEKILFILFFLSFTVKIPTIPLHLWLPQAHVEAPTTGSILLAGILLKLGSYGFIRFLIFLFPNASQFFLPLIMATAIISIILASLTVLRQTDLKRIIAYSSIAHMNFLVAAIFTSNVTAITGSLLLQVAHGLSSAALFFLVGILYDRYKTRNIYYYGGLVTLLPFFCFFFFVFSLANLGFPLTINFISELMILFGLFESLPTIGLISLFGIFFSAIYSFITLSRISFGPASTFVTHYFDLTRREFLILLPFAILVLVFGLYPSGLTALWDSYTLTWTDGLEDFHYTNL